MVDPESARCVPSDRGKSGVSGDGGGGVGGGITGDGGVGVGLGGGTTGDGGRGVTGEEAEAMTVTASFMPLMQ